MRVRPPESENGTTMDRTERFDNVVGIVTALTAAVCYFILFVAMSAPAAETLQRLIS
jgi:hypothetical protein